MKAFSCTELPVEYRDIRGLNEIRFVHPDPFDRILISQATLRPLHLATLDGNIIKTFEMDKAFCIFTDRPGDAQLSAGPFAVS